MVQELTAFLLIYLSMFTATITAYCPQSTDARWNHAARWTGQPPVVGISAACPESWKMQWIHVQGYGLRRCDDTPRHGWYDESTPHVDIYMATREEALNHGVRQLTVWKGRN